MDVRCYAVISLFILFQGLTVVLPQILYVCAADMHLPPVDAKLNNPGSRILQPSPHHPYSHITSPGGILVSPLFRFSFFFFVFQAMSVLPPYSNIHCSLIYLSHNCPSIPPDSTMGLTLDINIVIIAVVFSAATLLVVSLRFYARTRQHASFGLDDLLMIPAAVCAIGVGVANIISATHGHLGRHIQMGPDGPIYGEFLVTLFQVRDIHWR